MLRFCLLLLLVQHVCSTSILDDVQASKWVKDALERHEIETAADSDSPNLDPTDDAGGDASVNLDPTNQVASSSSFDLDPSNVAQTIDCLMEDATVGVCLQYYQCDKNRTIIEDGSTIIDFRTKSLCPSYLEVCCRHGIPDMFPETPALGSASEQSNTVLSSTASNFKQATEDECGWNNPGVAVFRKTNKHKIYADYGEFPWMIAVIKKSESTVWSPNDYIGGGSIIHPSVVITAAHKVDQRAADEVKCRAGEWDTQTTNELYPFQERDVANIVLHPNFYKVSLFYDAALLILERPFALGIAPHMGVACLSSVPSTPGEECFTMGWGKEFSRTDEYAIILKKTKLPLVGSDSCEELLQRTRLGPFFRLHQSLTCAGGEKGIDACQGDGGSPLVCPIKSNGDHIRYAMVGIVAYGLGCGKSSVPGVYVNVPEIYPWVSEVMAGEGYGNNTYTI